MSAQEGFEKLKRRYLLLRYAEIFFVASGTVLLTYSIASLWTPSFALKLSVSLLAGLFVFTIRARYYKLFKLENSALTSFLNLEYPSLKASADLLLKNPDELTGLQQLQRSQTLLAFDSLYPQIRLPHQLFQSLGILTACAGIYFALSAFAVTDGNPPVKKASKQTESKSIQAEADTLSIHKTWVAVTPPAYTNIKSFTTGSNLVVPEGSAVSFFAEFWGEPGNLKVIFSGRDSAELKKIVSQKGYYTTTKKITDAGFYQLQWSDHGKIHRTDYFPFEVIKDEAPKVAITNLNQFTKLRLTDNLDVVVKSTFSDDYGLTDGQIVATVSKGSGEGVKFREEKIRFVSPSQISGRQVQATVTLSLKKLGLEPGDELYFYAEALDGKTPVPNHHRTETFFISLQDTTTEITVADAGLGVDLMPEYFRSQRQIIIDTEKLLKEKKKLTKQVFNSTSNELGFDQKALRLRYGQFLGEEADSGIGKQEAEESEEEEDPLESVTHKHDNENEANQIDKKKGQSKKGESEEEDKKDPLKAVMHQHDNTEEATFFIQSVKEKLKAALTLMWDAELYLRLFEPDKSLPYQYKALNLLKEISNDSRIYVHRVGFDPPPLKEDKRLSADLSEVKNSTDQYANKNKDEFANIRKAIVVIEKLLQQNSKEVTPGTQRIFQAAGNDLASFAIERPGVYLRGLSLLKSLQEQQVPSNEMEKILLEVRKTLWQTLPAQSVTPIKSSAIRPSIDQKFLQGLEELKHE